MKLKRFFIISLCFVFFQLASFAQLTKLDFDVGYMYHKINTTYDFGSFDKTLQNELEKLAPNVGYGATSVTLKGTEQCNALAIGTNLRITWFYAGLNFGLPFRMMSQGFDPATSLYEATLDVRNIKNAVKAYIIDAYVGCGLPIVLGSLDIFCGVHGSVNYIDVKRNVEKPLVLSSTVIENVLDYTQSAALGIGGTFSLAYFFHEYEYIGIMASINYSYLLLHFRTRRMLSGVDRRTGATIEYQILDTQQNKNSRPKRQVGDNLTFAVGITFRY